MGGQISLTYTSLYPSDVASLWLLDSGGVWSAAKSERQKDPGSRQTQSAQPACDSDGTKAPACHDNWLDGFPLVRRGASSVR